MLLHFATSLSGAHCSSRFTGAPYTFALLLLSIWGVQYAAAAVTPSNRTAPITLEVPTPAESPESLQRICVALCIAGLGGLPCETYHCVELFSSNVKNSGVGDDYDSDRKQTQNVVDRHHRIGVIPKSDSKQYPLGDNNHGHGRPPPSAPSIAMPRRKVCVKLCEYSLGFPLCDCQPQEVYSRMDVDCVCALFCTGYGYRLEGCPACFDALEGLGKNISDEERQHNHWEEYSACNVKPKSTGGSPQEARRQIDWNQWCKERCAEGDGGAACNCDILPLNFEI